MRSYLLTAVAAGFALAVVAPGSSRAAYMGFTDDLGTINYYAGNSNNDILSYAFDGGTLIQPPQNGAAITGSQGSGTALTFAVSPGASISPADYVFEYNGAVIAELTESYDSGTGITSGTYTDYLAQGLSPSPTNGATVETVNAGANLFGFTPPGGALSFAGEIDVPEPTTMALLGAGLLGLGAARRRRGG